MFDFTGRTALVTGAARGIGRRVALELAANGAKVCLCDLDSGGLKETAERCGTLGREAVCFTADVSGEEAVAAMVDEAGRRFGGVDILVNNAGILADKMIGDITADEFDRMLAVHLRGTFLTCRAVLPHMRGKGYGRIVNVTSLGARQGVYLAGCHYCAAKGGMTGLTRQLAQQLRGEGITVNCVAPGTTKTELIRRRDPAVLAGVAKMFPAGRLGLPEEVAAAVLYLASDWARCITGETVDVNGGKYMT